MKIRVVFALLLLGLGHLVPVRAVDPVSLKLETVVLDPGHGGKDAGAVSKDNKTKEKDLALKIARKVRDKINEGCPGVKVVLTRDKDVFIPLLDRAEIANRNKANLFISIHINSIKKPGPSGFSAHILGESKNKNNDVFGLNMSVSQRENAVVQFEDDYSVKYQGFDPSDPASAIVFNLIQSAYYEQSLLFAGMMDASIAGTKLVRRGVSQDNFYVLWRTAMPSVLLECGFISNPDDLSYLRSEKGIDEIAQAIYEGFMQFKAQYESVEGTVQASAPRYGIQVFASSEPDKKIKGDYPKKVIKVGRYYKYIVYPGDDWAVVRENWKKVKKNYPDSFLVEIDGDKVTICRK
ncbi:MAG: N-acetylmuramoyl-L-alanine amidase [Bacteroidales bacterium]|nr:N-acetylmuramoyl-L-alanine amidase [Bacteroidales bacterium]